MILERKPLLMDSLNNGHPAVLCDVPSHTVLSKANLSIRKLLLMDSLNNAVLCNGPSHTVLSQGKPLNKESSIIILKKSLAGLSLKPVW